MGIAALRERNAFILSFSAHREAFYFLDGRDDEHSQMAVAHEMSQTTMRTMYPVNHHLDGNPKVNGIGGGADGVY